MGSAGPYIVRVFFHQTVVHLILVASQNPAHDIGSDWIVFEHISKIKRVKYIIFDTCAIEVSFGSSQVW